MDLSKLIPGFSIGISSLQNKMRKWGRREDVEKGKYWTIKRLFGDQFDWVQLCAIGWYWLLIIIIFVTLVNVAFCVMIRPEDDGTTTDTILIICAIDIMAIIIIIISLMLLDVVFCVIVCPEDGGATQPNKWWQPEPKGIYRMGAAMDKIWTNKQISFWWNLIV